MGTSLHQDMVVVKYTEPPGPPWRCNEHQQLALDYRMARKRLLQTVIEELQSYAWLLSIV